MAPSEDGGRTTEDGYRRVWIMVGLGGLEPPTSRLSSARSNQLSYKPEPEDRSQRTEDRMMFCPLSSVLRRPAKARPFRRKRNEDGGVPQRRPDWPFDSKISSREAREERLVEENP